MLLNGGRTNLSEWVVQIVNELYKERAIDERASFDNVKSHFHEDLHEIVFCTISTLLFKLLIDKGVSHIVEPRPPLVDPWSNNDQECIKKWEKFINNQEWKQYIKK